MKKALITLSIMMLIGMLAGFFLFSHYKEKYITGENAAENFQKGIGNAWDAISEGEFKEKIASNEKEMIIYLVPELKLSFSPISASDKNLNPQNTQCIPAVKILIFLDLDEKSWFSFRHYLKAYVVAQKKYNRENGRYTQKLSNLNLPKEMIAARIENIVGENYKEGFYGYHFVHVKMNGTTKMNYKKDFVLCAIPVLYRVTGIRARPKIT